MKTSVGVSSDVGRTRQANEDAYLVRDPLFVVADGMGGHVAGDVASRTAVDRLTEETGDGAPTADSLASLVRGANAAVFNKARNEPELSGMGTTCTVLLLEGADAHLAHVGDSRAYLFRDDTLQQITEDHTLVQRMVKEGRLNKEEAQRHPQRNIITRVLGVDPDVSVDTFSVEAKPGDRFLLCSDGLSSMIDDSAIEAALRRGDPAQETADHLVELANEAGGEDNITVVLVDVLATQGEPAAAAAASQSPASESDVAPAHDRGSDSSASLNRRTPAEAPSESPGASAGSADDASMPGSSSRNWVRGLVGAILVVAILGAAAYIAARYLWIERSFYVGVDDSGVVTIYRGVPQDFAGMTLHREEQTTDLAASDLPEFLQDDLEAGITTDSLAEAEQRVEDLEERASDEEFEREQQQNQEDGERRRQGDGNK